MAIDQVAIPNGSGGYDYLDIGADAINVYFNKTGSRLTSNNAEGALKELASNYAPIKRGTVQYWNSQPTLISELNCIYIYTDYTSMEGQPISAIKIGDGSAYLIDLPFVGEDIRNVLITHITNNVIHITAEERARWNNKITCDDSVSNEILILTRN